MFDRLLKPPRNSLRRFDEMIVDEELLAVSYFENGALTAVERQEKERR